MNDEYICYAKNCIILLNSHEDSVRGGGFIPRENERHKGQNLPQVM